VEQPELLAALTELHGKDLLCWVRTGAMSRRGVAAAGESMTGEWASWSAADRAADRWR